MCHRLAGIDPSGSDLNLRSKFGSAFQFAAALTRWTILVGLFPKVNFASCLSVCLFGLPQLSCLTESEPQASKVARRSSAFCRRPPNFVCKPLVSSLDSWQAPKGLFRNHTKPPLFAIIQRGCTRAFSETRNPETTGPLCHSEVEGAQM